MQNSYHILYTHERTTSPTLEFLIKIGKDEGSLVHQCFASAFLPIQSLHKDFQPATPSARVFFAPSHSSQNWFYLNQLRFNSCLSRFDPMTTHSHFKFTTNSTNHVSW